MENPKEFYRKFDSLLTEIYSVKGDNSLETILNVVLDFLGKDLHIIEGRIYENNDEVFDLIFSSGKKKYPIQIPMTDSVLDILAKHNCYIFSDPDKISNSVLNNICHTTTAAFEIRSDERHWIFVFELDYGWEREEIQFSLNTVRKVISSRLISENFKSYISQAELIQKSLLPLKPPKLTGFDIAGRSIPTEIVGGDLYDYIMFDSESMGVAIGDASGHGLPAALLVRDVVTGLRMGIEKQMKMTYALEKLNRVIHRSRLSTSFISLFYAEIETNGNIIYANAGHPTPILVKKNGFEEFNEGGLILGPLPDIKLKRGFQQIDKDDVLFLYTDGLIERKNSLNEQFGIGRIKNLIYEKRKKTALEILEEVIEESFIFGNKTNWLDDVTVVVIKKT